MITHSSAFVVTNFGAGFQEHAGLLVGLENDAYVVRLRECSTATFNFGDDRVEEIGLLQQVTHGTSIVQNRAKGLRRRLCSQVRAE